MIKNLKRLALTSAITGTIVLVAANAASAGRTWV